MVHPMGILPVTGADVHGMGTIGIIAGDWVNTGAQYIRPRH